MKVTIKVTSKEIAALVTELQEQQVTVDANALCEAIAGVMEEAVIKQETPVYETITPELKLSLNPKVWEANRHCMNSQAPSKEGGSVTEMGAILKLNADDMIETLGKVTQKTEELAERLEHIHQLQKELTT